MEGAVAGVPVWAEINFEWNGPSLISNIIFNRRPARLYMIEESEMLWVYHNKAGYKTRGLKVQLFVELFGKGKMLEVIVCNIQEDMLISLDTLDEFKIDIMELFGKYEEKGNYFTAFKQTPLPLKLLARRVMIEHRQIRDIVIKLPIHVRQKLCGTSKMQVGPEKELSSETIRLWRPLSYDTIMAIRKNFCIWMEMPLDTTIICTKKLKYPTIDLRKYDCPTMPAIIENNKRKIVRKNAARQMIRKILDDSYNSRRHAFMEYLWYFLNSPDILYMDDQLIIP